MVGRPAEKASAYLESACKSCPSPRHKPAGRCSITQGRHSSSESPPLLLRFFLAAGPAAVVLVLPPPPPRLAPAFYFGGSSAVAPREASLASRASFWAARPARFCSRAESSELTARSACSGAEGWVLK